LPKKEKKKKSWKERQRERQLKQQKAQEAYQIRKEREAERKPRKWPKSKILGALCLIALILVAYGIWQYTQPSQSSQLSTEPPPINPTNLLQTPYEFTMQDINGTQFSLRSFSGKVIVIHVMGVGCHGLINPINENQLKQLRIVCSSFCGNESVTLVTVAVATCPSSDLAQIRATYNVTWLFGNDYDNGIMDIAQKYATQGDGTIVLVDKPFHISDSYSTVNASTLSSKINQLLGA
jgi:hypothetical protein